MELIKKCVTVRIVERNVVCLCNFVHTWKRLVVNPILPEDDK